MRGDCWNGDAGMEETGNGKDRLHGNSVCSTQPCYESKTALKETIKKKTVHTLRFTSSLNAPQGSSYSHNTSFSAT